MLSELQQMLIEFRALGKEMKIAKDVLRGVRSTAEQRSTVFQNGYRLGLESAVVQRQQEELDKRKGTNDHRTNQNLNWPRTETARSPR